MPYESVPGFVAALDPAINGALAAEAADPDRDPHRRSRRRALAGIRPGTAAVDDPGLRVKNGADHVVPLTDEMLALLAAIAAGTARSGCSRPASRTPCWRR